MRKRVYFLIFFALSLVYAGIGFNASVAHAGRDKPIVLDNLTYARLMYEQWQKVVVIETILQEEPKNDVPTNDTSGEKPNDTKKLIKPYLVKPRFDKRVMGIRHAQSGTGFLCGADADEKKVLICTNAHVIEGGSEIIVRAASGKEYVATVLAEDKDRDVVVLAIENGEKFSPVVFGDSDHTSVGEAVMTIGHPFGYQYSLNRGIVSAKRFLSFTKNKPSLPFLQFDMALNFGNSGSPVFNMMGEVIGMVEGIVESSGIAFAIPANDFRKIIENIKVRQAPVVLPAVP